MKQNESELRKLIHVEQPQQQQQQQSQHNNNDNDHGHNHDHKSCPGDALLGSAPAPVQSPPADVRSKTGFGMHLRAAAQVVLGGVLPVEVAGEAGRMLVSR